MKYLNIKIIAYLVLLVILQSCASYQYSNKTENSDLAMNVTNSQNTLAFNGMLTQMDPELLAHSRSAMVGQAISVAAEGIKYLIEQDKKKYTAEYAVAKSDMYFYKNISTKSAFDPTDIQFKGFNILRTFKNTSGELDTALYISFILDTENPYEIINNSIFRLKVDTFIFNYSKAKIPGYRWYLPWTLIYKESNKANLDVEISLNASWLNKYANVSKNIPLGKFYLNLRDIPLDKDSDAYTDYQKSVTNKQLDGYCFLVPRSFGYYYSPNNTYEECFGQGLYNIDIKINEAGKTKFVTKIMQDNSDVIIDKLNNLIPK